MDLKEKVSELPALPGVYLMKDSLGNIIYVGKSKKLKSRVSSYFQNSKSHPPKVVKMVKNISDFDYIVTDTEFEAFILECILIKDIQPRYNKLMKNDNKYIYIKVTTGDIYPEILICKEIVDDKNIYFGPYTSESVVERAIEGIKVSCRILCSNVGRKSSFCLNYSLGLCMGMCSGEDVREEYTKEIEKIKALLCNKNDDILKDINLRMYHAAEKLDFAEAAKFRDYASSINHLLSKGTMIGYTNKIRNILAIEFLDEGMLKYFLIKGSRILLKEKLEVDKMKDKYTRDNIINSIFKCFSVDDKVYNNRIGKEEIDQSQIIYSYLKGKNTNCRYAVITQKCIKDKNEERINNVIDKLVYLT